MSASHTPGPWRFKFNAKHRNVTLVGGQPTKYDLTIMDFCRWGMNGATMLLRDTAHDGMNIMHKLHERPDWIAPQPGREHHKSWHQLLTHPDIRLIEAAPDLLSAMNGLLAYFESGNSVPVSQATIKANSAEVLAARAAIAKVGGEA